MFRVQAEGGTVTYYRNGALRYTSSVAASFPLLVDTSLRTPGATINDVAIEGAEFWTEVVGAVADGNDLTKTAPEDAFNAGAVSIESIAVGVVSIYESGTKIGNFEQYTAGDTFQVGVSGGAVTYYRNRIPIYTSLATPSFPLLLDTSDR